MSATAQNVRQLRPDQTVEADMAAAVKNTKAKCTVEQTEVQHLKSRADALSGDISRDQSELGELEIELRTIQNDIADKREMINRKTAARKVLMNAQVELDALSKAEPSAPSKPAPKRRTRKAVGK